MNFILKNIDNNKHTITYSYFDDLEDLVRKVKQNDPVVIRKDMMNENLKRLLDFRQQMCEALVGVEVNRKTPSEFDPSFITT